MSPSGGIVLKEERPPLALQLMFLGKLLDHLMEHQLASHGLNRTQALVLIALSHHEGLKVLDLCAHAWVEPANVTRTLQSLERLGLTERQPHPTDGRVSLLHLTETGRATAGRLSAEVEEFSSQISRDMGEGNAAHLEQSLGPLWRTVVHRLPAIGHHQSALTDQEAATRS
jgi:DNA-binding MarR family transcriptional regulator